MDGGEKACAANGRAGRWWRGLAAIGLALVAVMPAAAREVQFGARPEWVNAVAVPLDVQAVPGTDSGGEQYLLSDRQTRLEAHDRVAYYHFAVRAVTGDGVEDAAHVKMPFDPSYETLTLISIKVHRGNRVFSRLDPANVQVLQREKDLEARIYDGRKTANVMLSDVRIGDVVEYDYTIRGVNPAFRDRAFGSYDLQWKVPLQSMYARLLVPEGRDLQITPRNSTLQPEVQQHDGWTDYVWHASALAALDEDDDEPSWYDAFPIVQWSEYPNWAAVASWAVPLYRAAPDQGAELQSQVEAIAKASARPEDRLLATLRFVQREVRYLGIEVGIGSLAPRQPREVIEHRFGDCKDKALLTVWMLRSLGIEAQPALVNTRSEQTLAEYQPSPGLFDHVVVRARIDGRDYWLDPTRAVQKGTLANLSQASFGRALVVDAATTDLQPMLPKQDVLRRRDVHTTFDATAGRGKPVGMRVVTVYQGESAEFMRDQLAGESHDAVQRRYLNFYADYYPAVAVARPFTVSDDDDANRLTVTEYYTVGDLWKRKEEDKRFEAAFFSPEIESELHTPERTVRSGPLALMYPLAVTSVTEILLHKDWKLDIAPGSIEDPAFKFSDDTNARGSVVTVTERLQMLADHVPPDRVAAFVAQVKKARRSLGLELYMPDATAASQDGGLNWPVVLLGLIMAAGASWLARLAWRHDPAPSPRGGPDVPSGLAGWLILPAIGAVVNPLRIAKGFLATLAPFAPDVWSRLTVAGGEHYSAWWAPFLLLELAANIVLIAWSVTVLLLFFRKRTSLPRLYIAFLWASVLFTALDTAGAAMLPSGEAATPEELALMIRDMFSAGIWTWYFLVSRRVAATFVRRLRPAPEDVAAPPAPAPGPAEAVVVA